MAKPARKKASGYAISLFDSVHHLPAGQWNRVLRKSNFFMGIPYLATLEDNPPSNMRFRYALIYQGKNAVAAAYFQILDLSGDNLGSLVKPADAEERKGIRECLKDYFRKKAGSMSVELLICGNAFASGQYGFCHTDEIGEEDAFHALAEAIYRLRRAEKLRGKVSAVLVKDFYQERIASADELKQYKYYRFSVEPNMIIDLEPDWGAFEHYLGAMSKKYRKRALGIIKKGEVLKRRELSAAEIRANARRIGELYHNVHLKAKFRLASLSVDYFAEMQSAFPKEYKLVAYYLEGDLVAFRTSFITPGYTEAHFVGLDYGPNREHEIYQNMLYDYVREGIEAGVSQVHLGRTASEIKSTVGARAFDIACYVRHSNPLSNRIIRPFIEYLRPEEWIPRNPFKEAMATSS